MKVYNEVLDLGLDKGVIVTRSYATPDASAFAKSVGIDIIDGARLSRLITALGVETSAKEIVSENYYFPINSSCLRKLIKMSTTDCKVYYYPLYMFQLKITRIVKKGVLRPKEYIVESKNVVFIDAIKGYSIELAKDQILFKVKVPTRLSDEELSVYKFF